MEDSFTSMTVTLHEFEWTEIVPKSKSKARGKRTVRGGRDLCGLHARQRQRDLPKERLHVEARLRAGLDEHDALLARLVLAFFHRNLPATRPSTLCERGQATMQVWLRFLPHLRSDKSVLFPTNTMMTSLPRSARTSSIHLDVFRKDARSAMFVATHPGTDHTHTHKFPRAANQQKADHIRENGEPNKSATPTHILHRAIGRTRNIIHNNCNRRVSNVARNQRSEPLLAGCIPQL